MTYPEIAKELRRMKVETGSLMCLGCGHEHNCSTHGCAILREAADLISRMSGVFNENALINMTAHYLKVPPGLLRKISGEEVHLALAAGARAIDNNKRLIGASYCQDIFGKCGGPKMISYCRAAKILNELATDVSAGRG